MNKWYSFCTLFLVRGQRLPVWHLGKIERDFLTAADETQMKHGQDTVVALVGFWEEILSASGLMADRFAAKETKLGLQRTNAASHC